MGYDNHGVLTFVGAGGDYVQETSYKYVGGGAGNFDVVSVATNPRSNMCCWIIIPLTLLLLLGLLSWLLPMLSSGPDILSPTPAPDNGICGGVRPPCCLNPQVAGAAGAQNLEPEITQALAAPKPNTCEPGSPQCGPIKACLLYGDPHVNTFDGKHADYYTPGEYWIVKSDFVKIQGKYAPTPMTNGLAVTKGIAISGEFINGHKLIIGSLDQGQGAFTWDGQPILTGFPSDWVDPNGCATIHYNNMGTTMQKGRVDKPLHVLHIDLPFDIFVQVNEWNEPGEGAYINVKIEMPQGMAPNQDGHCGNYNNNPGDDARLNVRARVGTQGVDAADLMFPGGKTPINPTNRPDINNCEQGQLDKAKSACKKSEGRWNPSMGCLIDECFGGGGFAAEDVE